MMLYIHGASGHGKVVWHACASRGQEVEAFIDDSARGQCCGLPVLAPSEVQDLYPYVVHCAMEDNQARHQAQNEWREAGMLVETVIHEWARVYPSAYIGPGALVAAGAVVGPDARIGQGCIIHHNAVVEHDCVIGEFCSIGQGAVIGGGVHLGRCCLVEAGVVIPPGRLVGDNVTLGR